MNTQISKVLLIVLLSAILGVSAGAAVGTFTFKTSGASDTVEAMDLVYPQKVPEAGSVSTSSLADGSVTNAKLAEPVSVTNGGTGKTTAAEGLAALGGASSNGSSTVDFSAQNLSATGFSTFGELAVGIKMKVLTGTTGANEGDTATVNHALIGAKILAMILKIRTATDLGISEADTTGGYEAHIYHDQNQVGVKNHPTNSENILSAPFTVLIFYVE